jgi:secreted trypsin-like serine protease
MLNLRIYITLDFLYENIMIKFIFRYLCISLVVNIFLFTNVNADQASLKNYSSPVSTDSSAARIIGGTKADIGKYPWMTALIYSGENAYDGQFCGGALIAPQWVVTAAHCIEDLSVGDLEVLIGQNQLTGSDGERIVVDRILPFPGYDSANDFGDIALLHLIEPSTQEPIGIVYRTDLSLFMPFEAATIIGWGNISSFGYNYPDDLIEAEVMMLPFWFGRFVYGDDFIPPAMLVAGYPRGGIDSCDGDSGGPLVVYNKNKNDWLLVGITSWGTGCAMPRAPGVYTNVLIFSRWINRFLTEE